MLNGDELDLTTVANVTTILSSKADVPTPGTLRSKAAGPTKLSAIYVSPAPESRNLTASTNITVQDAFLQTIMFEPASLSSPLGRPADFKVKGRYSDGSEIDITTVVDITADISSPGMSYAATIARTGSNRIRVTGREVGTMKVIASFGSVSGSGIFNATQKEIDRVDIVRDQPYDARGFILKGESASFVAKLTFSDLTTENIASSDATRSIDWSPPDVQYASFNLNAGKMVFGAVKEGPAGFGVTVTEGLIVKSATFGMDIYIPCALPGRQNSYFCWYLGEVNKSCAETCQLQSRGYHSATNNYAGFGGVDADCKYLVEEIFKNEITANFSTVAQPAAAIGCSIFDDGSGVIVGARQRTLFTTDTDHSDNFRRICSCE